MLIQVIEPHYQREQALSEMTELMQLVKTYGGQTVIKEVQHLTHPQPSMYMGKGKVEWIAEQIKAHDIDVVVINNIVKSGQLFRIEKELWQVNTKIKVWDRIDLILNIFDQHAKSNEAKLQIELARIEHSGPRIFGLGGTVLSRQGGGIGTRGLGETNIEKERRLIKDRTGRIKKELKKLAKQGSQRIKNRQAKGLKTIALVGYTSAGKTTLFNQLTAKNKRADSSLFTTLDSVVGRLKREPSSDRILVSDTIGFIDNLPPSLIETFRSTLMESLESDLLLHVIDASDPKMAEKMAVVDGILEGLEADQQQLKIFNKIDKLQPKQIRQLKKQHSGATLISAADGDGISEVQKNILDLFKA